VGHDEQVLQRSQKKGVGGGKFESSTSEQCKGCAECVDACGDHDALKMIRKDDQNSTG
jgi:pyruvate-ferredoxin/flavodoxin oxidoreductase